MNGSSLTERLEEFRRDTREVAFALRRGYRAERWTYARVAETAWQLARELEARGIGKGDRVLLWGENCPEWVCAFYACMLRGAVAVPMDRIASAEFAQRVAQQTEARAAIGSRAQLEHWTGPHALHFDRFGELLAGRGAGPYRPAAVERGDLLEIIFTSGATADPRGVAITHGNVLANLAPLAAEIAKYRKYERWAHPIRFLNLLPLSHVFGQFMGVFVPPLLRGAVLFHDTLNPAEVIRTIQRERVSVLIAVPRMLESLKDKLERDAEGAGQLARFRAELEASAGEKFARRWWRFRQIHSRLGWKFWAIVSGGAALDAETEEFWRRLAFAVVQGYGMTETTSLVSVNHPFKLGRGSIGKVLPGREMKLSAEGEILVRGESIAAGYWQGGQLQPLRGEEGWLGTGDLGALDEAGNLYFKGRKKNVIVTGEGMKVYPEDLENALRRQSGVRDCVVLPLERQGNAVPGAVLLLDGACGEAEAAVQRANETLAEYQRIRHWWTWPEEDFPRTATHKPRTGVIAEFVARSAGPPGAGGRAFAEETGAAQSVQQAGSLASLVAGVTGGAPREMRPGAGRGTELNLSSLERVELLSAIEDRYQVELNESRFTAASTLADLEQMVRAAWGAAGPAGAPPRTDYHYPRWAQRPAVRWLRVAVYYLLTWPATWLLARPRIRGGEHLRGLRGPVIVISNHIAYLDVGFVLAALPGRLRHRLAVAMEGEKVQAMRHPPGEWSLLARLIERVSYWLMTALFNVFPLPQRAGFRESFQFAGESADRGYSVLVFPEGVRTVDGKMAPFRSGIGLLVSRLRLPVAPVRIDGLWEVKKSGRRGSTPRGAVRVSIGAPLEFAAGADPAAITAELERAVAGLGQA